MSSIGIMQPVVITPQALPVVLNHSSRVVALPTPVPPQAPAGGTVDQVSVSAAMVAQQEVQQKVQDIANTHVLGTQDFTLYEDATGQLITRYTDKETGKVTYIPEPTVYKMGG